MTSDPPATSSHDRPPDGSAAPIALTHGLWEVPTGTPGHSRYLHIVREWWSQADDHISLVLLVAPINTFDRDGRQHGDYALYIGSPPPDFIRFANALGPEYQREAARYAMANWVARNGEKLTEHEADGFSVSAAPNGIAVDWRD